MLLEQDIYHGVFEVYGTLFKYGALCSAHPLQLNTLASVMTIWSHMDMKIGNQPC